MSGVCTHEFENTIVACLTVGKIVFEYNFGLQLVLKRDQKFYLKFEVRFYSSKTMLLCNF